MGTPWGNDPLLRRLDAPLRDTFHPLGFELEIETNDERILRCACHSYGVFERSRSGAEPMRFRLLRDPASAEAPPWPPASYRAWGDLFGVVCGTGNFLVADLERRTAAGFFSPAMLEDAEFFRWTFLDCVTYMVLGRHHVSPVHAACVVRDGFGICLCGPAGAGKTSLAYSLAKSGYALLADDVVYVLRGAGGPQLCGNPSRLHFPVSARGLFPELREIPAAIRRDGAEFIPLDGRQLPATATRANPGIVVFLERTENDAAIEDVAADDAFRLLSSELPAVDEPRLMEEHWRALRAMAAHGTYRLIYSTFEQARQLLESISTPERPRK